MTIRGSLASVVKNSVISSVRQSIRVHQRLVKKKNPILLLEADGFGLRALTVHRREDNIIITATAQSASTTPATAMDEVLQQLAQQHVTLPKDAVLLSANAIPALLDLPVEQGASFSQAQMQELIRWEMETVLSNQISQWNIGWLLIGRGYLSEQAREHILNTLDEGKDATATRGGRAPARFGEQAIQQGYITREQLEECLAIQEELYLLDDTIDCSWLPNPTRVGKQKGLWFCCAISRVLRHTWVAACEQQSIRLHWIYPLAGAALPSLPVDVVTEQETHSEQKVGGAQVLIDIQPGYITCARVEQQEITHYVFQRSCDHALTVQAIAELSQPLFGADINSIGYSGRHPRKRALIEALSVQLQRPVWPLHQQQCRHYDLSRLDGDFVFSEWESMLGVGQHILHLSPKNLSITLQGQAPPPPLYQRVHFQLSAAVALLLLSAVANESYFAWRLHKIDHQYTQNEEKISKIEYANESITTESQQAKQDNEKLNALTTHYESLRYRRQLIESVFIKRQRFVESLLPLIATNTPNAVVIYQLIESEGYQLTIDGWATTQHTIDEFNTRLSRSLDEWNLLITDSPSRAEKGVNNMDGYAFNFTLTSKNDP